MATKIENHPFIPRGVHFVTQSGLFVGRNSTNHLTNFLSQNSSVTQIANPNINFGQRMEKAKKWFSRRIDQIRIDLSKSKLSPFLERLKGTVQSKEQWIREYFSLKEGNDLSTVVVRHVLNLFDRNISNFHSLVQNLKRGTDIQLVQIVRDQIDRFTEELHRRSLIFTSTQDTKIVNGVYDLLTPRVAVAGHSMGGLTALQSMQEGNNDIAMVIGFGVPINGADPRKIPAKWLLPKVFPMIRELMNGSAVLNAIYTTPIPDDSTMLAVDLKGRKDKVILPNNLNSEFTNAHNVQVEPKAANAFPLFTGLLRPVGFVLDHPPGFLRRRAESNRYHMAYLDERNVPFYFSEDEGSLLFEFAMGENALENTCRLLSPNNYGLLQAGFLNWLGNKIRSREIDYDLTAIKPALEQLKDIPLPFIGSEYDLAHEVSELI